MRPRVVSRSVGIGAAALVVALAIVGAVLHFRATKKEAVARDRVNAGLLSESDDTFAEVDPHVAANDRGAVVVSFMGISHGDGQGDAARKIGLRVSRDEGKTWGPIDHLETPGDRFATDSMLAAAPNGDVLVTWLGFRANLKKGGAPYDLGVFVARELASGQGTNWPIEITEGIRGSEPWMKFDKPWTAVIGGGATVTSYRFEAPMRAGIRVARSDDAIHFQDAVVVEERGFGGTLATICGEGANAYVAYVDASKSIWARVVLYRSADFGATWSRVGEVSREDEHVAVEAPYCATNGSDDLVVAYSLAVAPPDDSSSALVDTVQFASSRTAGRTWDARVGFRDVDSLMLHPTITRLGPSEFEILYASGKFDGDPNGSIRRVRWSGGVRTSETVRKPITIVTKRNPARGWSGDFFGVATVSPPVGSRAQSRTLEAFSDNSSGVSHVVFTMHE